MFSSALDLPGLPPRTRIFVLLQGCRVMLPSLYFLSFCMAGWLAWYDMACECTLRYTTVHIQHACTHMHQLIRCTSQLGSKHPSSRLSLSLSLSLSLRVSSPVPALGSACLSACDKRRDLGMCGRQCRLVGSRGLVCMHVSGKGDGGCELCMSACLHAVCGMDRSKQALSRVDSEISTVFTTSLSALIHLLSASNAIIDRL